jgi:ATP-dependent Clp protease ATP-binding subunit ClpA
VVFERFTERARQVVMLAQDESRQLDHNYIGTEHILLGLLREQEGLAARVLESLGITLQGAREKVVQIVGPGEEFTPGRIPFTAPAKQVLELALSEALSLGHGYIGTEHILLGLVRDNEGVSARVLLDFNADPEKIRNEVIRTLSGPRPQQRHGVDVARPVAEFKIVVGPDRELRRLLMAAGGRALAHERQEYGLADLLAVAKELPDAHATNTEKQAPEQPDT